MRKSMAATAEHAKPLSEYNLFDPDTLKCPYEFYRRLRAEAPVYRVPGFGLYLVSTYELIREVVKNTAIWSSAVAANVPPMPFSEPNEGVERQIREIIASDRALEPALLSVDPPDHAKHRTLVNKIFAASRVKTLVPYIDGMVASLIDAFIDDGNVEFMSRFAAPLPLEIIRDQLGVPEADREFFNRAANAAAEVLSMTPVTPQRALERAQLNHDLQLYFLAVCDQRRREPRDDMLTILVESLYEGERPLRDGEILSILQQFLVAGHETTTSALGAGMRLLIEQPAQLAALREDSSRIPTFVEEVLRLESPVQGLMRMATQDTSLGGVDLPKGSVIMLRYGAANRDEAMFDEPDRLDVCRRNANRQLAFGSGVHACVGAPLARQEMISAFAAIITRMQGFAFDPHAPAPDNDPSFLLRGLNQLHMTFERR